MIIYKGNKYEITTNGLIATKSDSLSSRTMKYYPERDITPLAGEIDELTAWRILRDVARQSPLVDTPISPHHILIDGSGFVLSEWSQSHDQKFTAPEGYSASWALAATVFYVFLGCHVFQGLGGKGQTPTAPVPTLRRQLPELSSLLVRCLDFNPENRPTMNEIEAMAENNILRCESCRDEFPPKKSIDSQVIATNEIDSYWPEEMC